MPEPEVGAPCGAAGTPIMSAACSMLHHHSALRTLRRTALRSPHAPRPPPPLLVPTPTARQPPCLHAMHCALHSLTMCAYAVPAQSLGPVPIARRSRSHNPIRASTMHEASRALLGSSSVAPGTSLRSSRAQPRTWASTPSSSILCVTPATTACALRCCHAERLTQQLCSMPRSVREGYCTA